LEELSEVGGPFSHPSVAKKRAREELGGARLTIGEYLLARLEKSGVRYVFGAKNPLFFRFGKLIEHTPNIDFVEHSHPLHSASAYARERHLGALLLSKEEVGRKFYSLREAYTEKIPLVAVVISKEKSVLTETTMSEAFGSHSKKEEVDTALAKELGNVFYTSLGIEASQNAAKKIDRLIDTAFHYQRPVALEVEEKMLDAFISPPTPRKTQFPPSDSECLRAACIEIIKCLKAARAPLLIIGRDVAAYQLAEPIRIFAEKWRLPCAFLDSSRTTLSVTAPLDYGSLDSSAARVFLQSCDCAFVLGEKPEHIRLPKRVISFGEEEVEIDTMRIPHTTSFELMEQLAALPGGREGEMAQPERKPPFQAIPREKLFEKRVPECVASLITEETVLVSTEKFCEERFPQNSYFYAARSPVAHAIGVGLASPAKKVCLFLEEDELAEEMELLFAVHFLPRKPVVVIQSKKRAVWSVLPTWLGSGHYCGVTEELELEKTLREALLVDDLTFLEALM
jgi:TPP-dependent 2-oxoacid decarboxylase